MILRNINFLKTFLNFNRYLPGSFAKATLICHETRTMFDAQLFKKLEHPLILPLARLGKLIQEQLQGLTIYDYGLSLEENAFNIGPRSCKLQWGMAAAYALAVSTQANAKIIKLVGFDVCQRTIFFVVLPKKTGQQ